MTLSEANGLLSKTRKYKNGKPAKEHWSEAHERHRAQKQAVNLALSPHRHRIQLPCSIRLVRLGPRELDWDNNVISMKYIRDSISEVIMQDFVPGRADSDKRLSWVYDQEKSKDREYYVKIEITW